MTRYRKLYTRATESLDINDMPDDFTRLLWVMLPLGMDSAGRGYDNTNWIKAKIMPLRDDVMPAMIDAAISWYAERGMVERYVVNGRKYFCITNWERYQGDTSRESKSELPPSPTQELLMSNSGVIQDELRAAESVVESESVYESESAVASASAQSVFRVYEEEIGALTPLIAQSLEDDVLEHGESWVCEALRIASQNGKRSYAYAAAILKRWKVDGYGTELVKKKGGREQPPVHNGNDYISGKYADFIEH